MPTNDTPFDSLGSLGSGYGKIEPTNLDRLSMSPFEGENLSMPKPDFSKDAPNHFVPIVPGAASLDNKQQSVRQLVGKPGQKPGGQKMSAQDFGKALKNYSKAVRQSNQDQNEYARIYSYDAGPSGNAFYNRYKAYGQETFDKIGFSPLRDNEAIFNAGTSGWDDTKRMMTHAFVPLFTRGFVSGPKSFMKMLHGDFSADTEDAEFYSNAAAIGQSTKGGISGMLNNTAMSFGYTAGIITEAILEEAAAAAITAATAGGGAPVLFGATANNLRKIPTLLRGVKALDKGIDGMRAVNTTLRGLDNVNTARKFWEATKAERALSTPVGRFLNPVENLTQGFFKIAKNEDNFTGLARIYDASKTTVGSFYRQAKDINVALSEARLEGGMQQNEVYEKLYNDYYDKNGHSPSDKEQEMFIKTAKEAGMTDLIWNTGLIFMSNKIVFDNVVGGKAGARNWIQGKTREILNLETGSIVRTAEKKALSTGKELITPKLNWRKNNLGNTLRSFAKDPLRKSIKGGLSYFKANITEAIQENAQDVISEVTKNYYIDSFSDPSRSTYQYAAGLTKAAVKNQFSAQGAETFTSGLIMGMFASPLNAVPKAFSIGYNKIFDKQAYEKYKEARDTYGTNLVNQLSSVDVADFWNHRMFTLGAQSSASDVIQNGEEKEARDAADIAFVQAMGTAAENNMMDLYIDQLESFRQLSGTELEEAVPTIPQGKGDEYLEKLPQAIERAKKIEDKYNYYKKNFPNPVNLDDWKNAKDSPDYEDAVLTHHAWNVATRNAVLLNETFDNTAKRMVSITNDIVSNGPLKNIASTDLNLLFDTKKIVNETEILKTEIETLKQAPKGSVPAGEIANKEKKLKALQDYQENLGAYLNATSNRAEMISKLKASNPDITQDEIEEALDKATADVRIDLEKSYNDYLKTIAKLEDKHIFNNDIDASFEKLIDFYKLDRESKSMVEYINLLHNPKEFVEHVRKNKVWMKDLYNNRRDYYEALKEQEFQKKEGNDLLNALADRNLYISEEDFQKWQMYGVYPEEIFDNSNKTVIRDTNPKYDEIIMLFKQLSDIQGAKSTLEVKNEALSGELAQLDNQMQAELDALEKVETRKELGEISKQETVTLKQVDKSLGLGEFVDLTYSDGTEDITTTLFKDEDGLKFNNEEGDIIDSANAKALFGTTKFKASQKYKIVEEANPDEVKQITDKYEKLKAEAYQRNIESGSQLPEATPEVKMVSPDTPANALPVELHNQLMEAFLKYGEDKGFNELNEDDFNEAFDSFIRTNYIASKIIDDYNKEQELATATKVEGEEEGVPNIKIGDKIYSLDDLSETEIKSYLKSYELGLKQLEEKENPTEADETQAIYYRANIKTINDYFTKRKQKGFSAEQKATVNALKDLMDVQSKIKRGKKGYEVDGVLMQRVTNVIRQFEDDYEYKDTVKVRAAYYSTIGAVGLTEDSAEAFMDKLKAQPLKGFSDFTYGEIETELNALLEGVVEPIDITTQETLLEGLEKDLETERGEFGNSERANELQQQINDLNKKIERRNRLAASAGTNELTGADESILNYILNVVGETTYQASRDVGNYLDDQIRNVFDGKNATFNDKYITQEAFDQLFSREVGKEGYVTTVKNTIDKEGLYIISRGYRDNGVILYDKDAKVAGEMDLLAVDRLGNVFIIDVKTGRGDKWSGFFKQNNKYSKKDNYTLQQTAYANLLYNMTGLKAKVSLLPIQVDYNDNTSIISEGGRPKAKDILEPGKFRIPLEITEDIQAKIDSIIPRKAEEVPTAPARESSDEEESPAVVNQNAEPVNESGVEIDPELLKAIKIVGQEQLDMIKTTLATKISQGVFSAEDVIELQKAIDERQRELSEGAVSKLSINNLAVGTQLVANATIFTGKNNTTEFATQGNVVRVTKINQASQTITLKTIGAKPKQKTISFEELDKLFKLKQTVMNLETSEGQPDIKLTPTEQSHIVESSDNVRNLLVSDARKEELRKEADAKSVSELDNMLFEDTTSDC